MQELKKEDKTEAANVAGQLANSFNKHEVAISVIEDVNAAAKVAIVSEDPVGTTGTDPVGRTISPVAVPIDLKARIQEKAEIANRDKSNLDNEIIFDAATGLTIEQEHKIDDEALDGTDIFDGDAEKNIDLEETTDPSVSLPPTPPDGYSSTTVENKGAIIVPISPTPGSGYRLFGR